MKHFFILGRNPELSRAEVLAFFEARGRHHIEVLFEDNFLVIETGDGERLDVNEFGGVMKMGPVLFEGEEKNLAEYLDKNELVPADKFSFGVFGNGDVETLKGKFKTEKKRAVLKHGKRQIKFQDGEKVELPNADYYLFFHEFGGTVYLGLVSQEYDVESVKERDMWKPVRRESLAISPRLSKILINLSGAKPGDLMLDPFCGVGGILQEALLKKISVHGSDRDGVAINDGRKNLKWLSENYDFNVKYTMKVEDARKVPDLQFGAVATETPLGKVFRKKPSGGEAEKVISNFEGFIVPVLSRLKRCKKAKARIAITFPAIRDFRVDAHKVADKSGLKLVGEPILESREDQFVSREIVVLV